MRPLPGLSASSAGDAFPGRFQASVSCRVCPNLTRSRISKFSVQPEPQYLLQRSAGLMCGSRERDCARSKMNTERSSFVAG